MHIQTLCSHPVHCNVHQHLLPHSQLFLYDKWVWEPDRWTDRQTELKKKKKTISLPSINLSINRSLLLYLSFALIREKISVYHVTLKTEAHYILLVITSEFLPHFPVETVANGSADSVIHIYTYITTGLFLVNCFFSISAYSWKTSVMPQGCRNYSK